MIHTSKAGFVPLNSLSRLWHVSGPAQINHSEQHRSIVVRIIPPIEVSMEKTMGIVQTEIVELLLKGRGLGTAYHIRLTGTADDLSRTRDALKMRGKSQQANPKSMT